MTEGFTPVGPQPAPEPPLNAYLFTAAPGTTLSDLLEQLEVLGGEYVIPTHAVVNPVYTGDLDSLQIRFTWKEEA